MICGKPTKNGGVCGNLAGHCRWHDIPADVSQPVAETLEAPSWTTDIGREPPNDARKAEDWDREDRSLPWQTPRCRECNYPMWTREPAKHDTCEECGWLIRDQLQTQATQLRQQRSDRLINPFSGSILGGQTGSLPTPK